MIQKDHHYPWCQGNMPILTMYSYSIWNPVSSHVKYVLYNTTTNDLDISLKFLLYLLTQYARKQTIRLI